MKFTAASLIAALLPAAAVAQGLEPSAIRHPVPGSWPTYNGDYSGRRFSPLKRINQSNGKYLQLAWLYHVNTGSAGGPLGTEIKSTPLEVDGVLYFTVPDHAWAIDARTGREIWHYKWESKGGIHTGNRGVGIYHEWLFFETPDNHLISLNKNTGKFRWAVEIADLALEYFSTPAPLVIRNHIVVVLAVIHWRCPAIWRHATLRRALCNGDSTRSHVLGNPEARHGRMPKPWSTEEA